MIVDYSEITVSHSNIKNNDWSNVSNYVSNKLLSQIEFDYRNPNWIMINSTEGDYEAGFDLTDFGSANNFQDVLEELGGDKAETFRVSLQSDHHDKRLKFVWMCDGGILITGRDPITGEYSVPEMRFNSEGSASYIGIKGTYKFVEGAFELIKREGHWKDCEMGVSEFIN